VRFVICVHGGCARGDYDVFDACGSSVVCDSIVR
jgi:hypothetical protein